MVISCDRAARTLPVCAVHHNPVLAALQQELAAFRPSVLEVNEINTLR